MQLWVWLRQGIAAYTDSSPAIQARVKSARTTAEILALGKEFVTLVEDGHERFAERGWPKTTYGVSKMLLIAYDTLVASCYCAASEHR